MQSRKLNAHILLNIITPVFNEQNNIEPFLSEITECLNQLPCQYKIIFVNDGSHDDTLNALIKAQTRYRNITVISFTRNFGKEAALTAGFSHASGNICIPMDADLQHPPHIIPLLLHQWEMGFNHVIAVRNSRIKEPIFRKIFTLCFYKLFNLFSDFNIPNNAGDFRLLDQSLVKKLLQLKERNRFMKGLYAWIGGETVQVPYNPRTRAHHKSTFNFKKLLNFSLDGITAFSSTPLRISSFIGITTCLLSSVYGGYLIIKKLVFGVSLAGYTSVMVMILFFGGINLLSLGIIGEYLSRLFIEIKQRPLYMIDTIYENTPKQPADNI